MTYLSGENLVAGYGGADILHGCSIDVSEGEIAVIVGPNGSGKSTAMKAIFGMLKLKSGNVKIKGEDITSLSVFERVKKGMAFVPQTNNVFTSLTVEENLEMGAFLQQDDFSSTMEDVYALFPVFWLILTFLIFGEIPTLIMVTGGIIVVLSVFMLQKIR